MGGGDGSNVFTGGAQRYGRNVNVNRTKFVWSWEQEDNFKQYHYTQILFFFSECWPTPLFEANVHVMMYCPWALFREAIGLLWLTRFFRSSSFGLDKLEEEFLDRKVIKVRVEGGVVLLYVNKGRVLTLRVRKKTEREREGGKERERKEKERERERERERKRKNQSLRLFTHDQTIITRASLSMKVDICARCSSSRDSNLAQASFILPWNSISCSHWRRTAAWWSASA